MRNRTGLVLVLAMLLSSLLLTGCPLLLGYVTLVGDWLISFQWSWMTTPETATITFNADHSFTVESESGTWTQDKKNFSFKFDNGWRTEYTGILDKREGSGTMRRTVGTPVYTGTFTITKTSKSLVEGQNTDAGMNSAILE